MKLLLGGSRDAASRVSTIGTVFRPAIFVTCTIILSFTTILNFTNSAAAQDHAMGTTKPVTMMTGLGAR